MTSTQQGALYGQCPSNVRGTVRTYLRCFPYLFEHHSPALKEIRVVGVIVQAVFIRFLSPVGVIRTERRLRKSGGEGVEE